MNGKYILAFVGGLVSGSVLTFFSTKKIFEKKSDAEIAEIREYYKEKAKFSKYDTTFKGENPEDVDNIIKTDKPENENSKVERDSIEYSELSDYLKNKNINYKKYSEEASVVDVAEDDIQDAPVCEFEPISGEEFTRLDDYKAYTWTYFEKSDIFMDSNNNIVQKPARYIGDIMDNLAGRDVDDDALYVINHNKMTKYEIIIESEVTYEEYIGED